MLNMFNLTKGAHAKGDIYPQAVPFEVKMEHIRGHNRIDLNNTGNLIALSSALPTSRGCTRSSIEYSFSRLLKGICWHDRRIFPQEAKKGRPARPQPMKAPEA